MKCIQDNLSRPISRRTYYDYKKKVYKNHEKHSPYFGLIKNLDFGMSRDLVSLSLMSSKSDIMEEGLKENIQKKEFDRLDLHALYLNALESKSQVMLEHSNNFIYKTEAKKQIVSERHESIPDNAIIREEFIKCGKDSCLKCPHGPYFYAYWKDENGKLRKRYVGLYKPTKLR
jgi:hypothetical protein